MSALTEDLVRTARSIAAIVVFHHTKDEELVSSIRAGQADDRFEVQTIYSALVEERRRCIQVAASFFQRGGRLHPDVPFEDMDKRVQKACLDASMKIVEELTFSGCR